MKKILILCCLWSWIAFTAFAYEWKASWISADNCQNAPNTWLNFNKEIQLYNLPQKAIARIAADSKYWLWINGELIVFEGGLKRGPNPWDTYYDEVDITPYLRSGNNTIAVLLWYFGKQGFSHHSSGKAGLLFDCQTPEMEILSDGSWKCSLNKAYGTCGEPVPNYRLSESDILYDARADMGEWYKSMDKNTTHAVIVGKVGGSPWNGLVKRPIPLWKFSGLKDYVRVYQSKDSLVCVLPYNAQVTPYFKIKAKAGSRIIMATDNYFHYNGATENIRGEYITKSGEQEYESLGWMNGHRVYYLLPDGVEVLEVKYRESGYDCDFAGNFTSSDSLLNKLWQKSARTLYVTMRDSYMDCPERERAQWAGDAVNESGETYYALSPSSHALTKKWLYELADWQKDNGVIFAPVPAGNWDVELPGQILASIGYYGAWNYYLHTGDLETLRHIYPAYKRYLDLWKEDANHVVALRDVGWLWGDWGENRDVFLLINAWYYLALKGMYLSAVVLHHTDDATLMRRRMSVFKEAFNRTYWNGCAYRSPSYQGNTDDRVQALAVVSGLADKDKYNALLSVFQSEFHASPYMEKYVFEAMMRMGSATEALTRHRLRMKAMVENPYFSTLFEHWNVGIDGYDSGSVNHAWTGGGLTVLSEYLCGISPLSPGYEKIAIIPSPGDVRQATATVCSVKGKIISSFEQLPQGIKINVKTPMGVPTVVGVPNEEISEIRMNGHLVWKKGKYVKDGKRYKYEDSISCHIKFLMPGGNYVFESKK